MRRYNFRNALPMWYVICIWRFYYLPYIIVIIIALLSFALYTRKMHKSTQTPCFHKLSSAQYFASFRCHSVCDQRRSQYSANAYALVNMKCFFFGCPAITSLYAPCKCRTWVPTSRVLEPGLVFLNACIWRCSLLSSSGYIFIERV